MKKPLQTAVKNARLAEQIAMGRVYALRTVRIFYEKTGRMKFMSHLDMNRFMSRIITKSKIPVWYTEGFNQRIYVNYAVPLSLGFEGLYEIIEFRLIDDNYTLSDCLEALKRVSPADINFYAVSEPKLPMKDIGFAEFKLTFDDFTNEIHSKLNEFLNRDSIICEKKGKKGKIKEIDIIPKIRSFSLSGNELTLCLTAGNEDNLNPSLVMSAFFEQTETKPIFYSVVRTLLLDKNGNKFI